MNPATTPLPITSPAPALQSTTAAVATRTPFFSTLCCSHCCQPLPPRTDGIPGPERFWGTPWDVDDWICRSCRDESIRIARERAIRCLPCRLKGEPTAPRKAKPTAESKPLEPATAATPAARLRVGEERPVPEYERDAIACRALQMKMDRISEHWLPIIQPNFRRKCPTCSLRDDTLAEMIGREVEE